MTKIAVHPGGFIKRNYIDELGLTAAELADALEVSESTLSRLIHEKIDLSPALAVKLSKVQGRSAESWIAPLIAPDRNISEPMAASAKSRIVLEND